MTKEDAKLFASGHRYPQRWPGEGTSLTALAVVELARRAETTPPDLAARLTALGYEIAPDPALLQAVPIDAYDSISQGDPQITTVYPDQLHAVSQLLNIAMDKAAHYLTRMGLDVQPIPEAFAADLSAEELLAETLDPASATTVESARQDSRIGPISLPALASVAMRHKTTLREVALLATQLGMRHEADGWFG
ncbi:hypothetical protein ABZU86_10010 [Streptomyces sp. NPDC005271]|uniref:wHTH domain-containing protein n=1 Tax=unclassified Streptomyces TaxID=2593676 RepID=UPI0033A3B6DA